MFSNLKAKILKFAQSNYKIYGWFKEYSGIFITVGVLKLLTSAVSIVTGYQFMYNTFYKLCQSETWSKVFSVASLSLIELLSAYFIGKAGKNFWHRRFMDCAKLAVGGLAVFSLSTYISVKGMVLFTTKKVDNTEVIVNENKILLDNLTSEHNDIVTQYKNSILEIKNNPEGWVNGKRMVLTSAQQENIQRLNNYIKDENDRFYKERAELKEDKNASLIKNENETEEEASDYGKYVALIMAMQLITSVGVSYCCMKISLDGNEELEFAELAKDVQDYAVNTIANSTMKRFQVFGQSIANAVTVVEDDAKVLEKNKNLIFARSSVAPSVPASQTENQEQHVDPNKEIQARSVKPIPTPQKPIGFNVTQTENTEPQQTDTPTDNGAYGPVVNGQTDGKTNGLRTRICPFCNQPYEPKTYNQRFCCTEHKNAYWNNQGVSVDKIKMRNKRK